MSPTLKQGINEYYTGKELSDSQHERLNHLMDEWKNENAHGTLKNIDRHTGLFGGRKTHALFTVQSSIALVISCISLALLISFALIPNSANIQDVAIEVAGNHRHLKPLTIQSNSYQQVGTFFSELSFELKPSSLLNDKRWQLLGGRYCSVNGIKAAQLRLLDTRNNSIQTFYQVEHKTTYFENIPNINRNELPVSVSIDGLPVEVWSEGGILYSLTHETDQ